MTMTPTEKLYTNALTRALHKDLGAAATSIGVLIDIMNDQLLIGRPDAACEIKGVDLYLSRLKADRLSELGHLIAATLDEILTSEPIPAPRTHIQKKDVDSIPCESGYRGGDKNCPCEKCRSIWR